jgi:hypothetical protein
MSDEAACPALAQVIDYELGERMADEIGAAYQSLCCMILLRTTLACSHKISTAGANKTEAHNKRAARRWIDGGVGVLTFESVCESLDLDPDYTRKGIIQYAESVMSGTIRKARKPKTHIAFGRSHVPDAFDSAEDSPPS